MAATTSSTLRFGINLEPHLVNRERVTGEVLEFVNALQEQFDRIWKITRGEFNEFVQGTATEMSGTLDNTYKEMKSLTGKSLGGTMVAWFRGDMDQVEDIWENAWDSMIGKADRRRLQRSHVNNKGPEVFPGALSFRLAA